MSDHEYEGRVWAGDSGWHAKVLRNGIYFDARNGFETRNEAVTWAREQANEDRRATAQERESEKVEL